MLLRRAATLLLALALFVPAANAANFPGWTRTYDATTVTLLSPQDQHGAVSIVLGVAEAEKGDPKVALRKAIDEGMASFGADMRLTNRSGVRIENGVLIETLRVRFDDAADVDVLIFAYHTGAKIYQAGALLYPSAIPEADPRVNHALDFIATAVRAKYRLTDARPASNDLHKLANRPHATTDAGRTRTATKRPTLRTPSDLGLPRLLLVPTLRHLPRPRDQGVRDGVRVTAACFRPREGGGATPSGVAFGESGSRVIA